MKGRRHSKILELIAAEPIDTQEGLLDHLKENGFDVTQATVSRDIRELGIHKLRDESGKYRYVSAAADQRVDLSNKFSMIFCETVCDIDFAQNIVVVKCYSGMANAACATFDAANFEGVVGTLSGDDTFFVITRNNEIAWEITQNLRKLLQQ